MIETIDGSILHGSSGRAVVRDLLDGSEPGKIFVGDNHLIDDFGIGIGNAGGGDADSIQAKDLIRVCFRYSAAALERIKRLGAMTSAGVSACAWISETWLVSPNPYRTDFMLGEFFIPLASRSVSSEELFAEQRIPIFRSEAELR